VTSPARIAFVDTVTASSILVNFTVVEGEGARTRAQDRWELASPDDVAALVNVWGQPNSLQIRVPRLEAR
jgi:hypothetical protein